MAAKFKQPYLHTSLELSRSVYYLASQTLSALNCRWYSGFSVLIREIFDPDLDSDRSCRLTCPFTFCFGIACTVPIIFLLAL